MPAFPPPRVLASALTLVLVNHLPAQVAAPAPAGAAPEVAGEGATASGEYARAVGARTWAESPFAYARGAQARAVGDYTTAAGEQAVASQYYARALGGFSTASGGYARALGFLSSASADYAEASGYTALATSGFARSPGYFSAATGWYAVAEMDYTSASGHFSRASGFGAVAGTPALRATVDGLVVTPYRTINDNAPTADLRAHYAPGDHVQLAPGAEGYEYVPDATPAGRARLPETVVVAAVSATTLTLAQAPAQPWPKAYVSNLSRGMHQEAHAPTTFDNDDRAGDAQRSRYVAAGVTLGAERVRLTANGMADAHDNRLRLKWGQALAVDVRVVAESEDGEAACFVRRALVKCSRSGETRLVGEVQTPVPDLADAAASGWTVAVEADDENDALAIHVTGADGRPVRWMAAIDAVEVAWFPRR